MEDARGWDVLGISVTHSHTSGLSLGMKTTPAPRRRRAKKPAPESWSSALWVVVALVVIAIVAVIAVFSYKVMV